MSYPYIIANEKVTVTFPDGKSKTLSKTNEDSLYTDALTAIKNGEWESLEDIFDRAKAIKKFLAGNFVVVHGSVQFSNENGELEVMPDTLADKALEFMNNSFPVEPLVKFWENLRQNPSLNSRECLYQYLENNNFAITNDGSFIAYKGITNEYVDIHSRSVDNSVGARVEMPRNQVDDNINNTCSRGLHVANFNYANQYYGGQVMVMVKVNPKDVVAVPYNYDNEKMRVCGYDVVQVVEREHDTAYVNLNHLSDEHDEHDEHDEYENDDYDEDPDDYMYSDEDPNYYGSD